MNQFIYFVCHDSNIDLLKEELRVFYPNFSLSFSHKGFLTYKNKEKNLSEEKIKKLSFAFALDWGESQSLDKVYIENLLKKRESQIELPDEAPSRAYLKIAEACEKFKLDDPSFNWLEFGSAPGGASQYLTNHFNKVYGVDPGEMDSSIIEKENFRHIQRPIQNMKRMDLPNPPIHYIASDLNLNPKQAITEVLRHADYYKGSLKGILMTIKLIKLEHVKNILLFEESFRRTRFRNIHRVHLPSHKREYLIFARKI